MFRPTEQWNLADMAKRKSIQTVAEAIFQHLQTRNPTIKDWVEWFDYPKEIVVRMRGTDLEADLEAIDFTTSYGQKLLKQLQKLVDFQSLVDQGDDEIVKAFLAVKKQREELKEEHEHLRYYLARMARMSGGSIQFGRFELIHALKLKYRYSEAVQRLTQQLNELKQEEEQNGTAKLEDWTDFIRVVGRGGRVKRRPNPPT